MTESDLINRIKSENKSEKKKLFNSVLDTDTLKTNAENT